MPERRRARMFGLLCLLLAAVAASLGVWQHQRAALKDRLQAEADRQLAAAPLRLGADADAGYAELVWRQASASGTWDRDHEILIDNRMHERQPGYHVITPLLVDGRWLLVNRGWVPAPPTRAEQPAIPPPDPALLAVTGLLAPDASDAFELAPDDPTAAVWQNLKLETWRARVPGPVYPVVLLSSAPAPGLQPVAKRPDFRAEVSRGYRLQWFGLAAVFLLAWLRFAWRPYRNRHAPSA